MNFLSISVAFYSFIRPVDVPCPMSHVGFFLKMCWPYLYPLVHVVAWACLELH